MTQTHQIVLQLQAGLNKMKISLLVLILLNSCQSKIVKEYDSSGELIYEYSINEFGLKDGIAREYNKGKLSIESNYANG